MRLAFGRTTGAFGFRPLFLGSKALRPAKLVWSTQKCKRVICSSAQKRYASGEVDGVPGDAPQGAAAPKEFPCSLTNDDLLEAFDKLIEEELEESDRGRATPRASKAKVAGRNEGDDDEYLRRLEVLKSLPTDLFVAPQSNQCPGCGCTLQSDDASSPGFVPPDRQSLTVRTEAPSSTSTAEPRDGPPKVDKSKKPVVCQRCYRLSHYGRIEDGLRVKPNIPASEPVSSQSDDADDEGEQVKDSRGRKILSASRFRQRLEMIRSKNAIVVYLVDIFDFHGTFLTSLREIVGRRNPIVLAVNKIDLLPDDFKAERVERWIRKECESLGIADVAAVHMISSTKGRGVNNLLADVAQMAKSRRSDIYVVGAANVGKSSFINKVVALRRSRTAREKRSGDRGRVGNKEMQASELTTSVIPGTTLDTIRIPVGKNVSLYDTPGIIVDHQLTNRLSADELRAVLPSKKVTCVTYRLGEGKALYLGALARIDVVEGKPFFFTTFVSPEVKVHPGKSEGASEFAAKHVGSILTPPFSEERLAALGEWTSKTFTAVGDGWKRASTDIVLSGLGWVAITGPGTVKLRVSVPRGIGVFAREALMPFEVKEGISKYTGSRGLNRKRANKAARQRKHDDKFSNIDDWS